MPLTLVESGGTPRTGSGLRGFGKEDGSGFGGLRLAGGAAWLPYFVALATLEIMWPFTVAAPSPLHGGRDEQPE